MDFLEKLKFYFETTPKEQIQSDWDSTAEFDQDYPFEIYLPSMENKPIRFEWKKGEANVFPTHPMVQNWLFTESTQEEAILANAMAAVAEKSGMTSNDLQHIFPAVLRMLKNNSAWSK